jgi:streptogramin lyase
MHCFIRHLRSAGGVFALTLMATSAGAGVSGIALEASGAIVLVDDAYHRVMRVDPVTGAITTVSSATVGAGLRLSFPQGIAVEPSGSLLVGNRHEIHYDGQERLVRVDPVSGDRTTVSDATTGEGPLLRSPRRITLAADGGVLLDDDSTFVPGGPLFSSKVLRIDPQTGDRATLADPTTGSGAPYASLSGPFDVAADGTLVYTADDAVMRLDPATGVRTLLSDETTGTGPRLIPHGAIETANGSLAVLNSDRALFCFQFCPSDVCVACFTIGPSILRVDPATGDRRVMSGGGIGLEAVGGGTARLGSRGGGPDLVFPLDFVFEAARTLLVVDGDRLMRVNTITGARTIFVDDVDQNDGAGADSVRASLLERVQTLRASDPRRVYQPRNPRAWLREALGAEVARPRGERPGQLAVRVSAALAGPGRDRFYVAMLKIMRAVLGADDPDVAEAERAVVDLACAQGCDLQRLSR